MKKSLLLLFSLLGLAFWFSSAMAQSIDSPSPTTIQVLDLDTVKTKIRAKETFYLFIGREDNRDAQLALGQLAQASSDAPLYYLNVKGVDGKAYKAFSKKYQIRSHSYLAKFSQRQQVAVYHNHWQEENDDLIDFLNSNTP